MAQSQLYNIARVGTTTIGRGTLALSTPVESYLSFAGAGVTDGATVSYVIEDGDQREIGQGVFSLSANKLTRATIIASTQGGASLYLSGYAQVYIDALAQDLAQPLPPVRQASASGAITASATDGDILVNKATPAATTVKLPSAASATRPISIKDFGGNASTYNITIVPNGSDTIDGAASIAVASDWGAVTLYPLAGIGWYQK